MTNTIAYAILTTSTTALVVCTVLWVIGKYIGFNEDKRTIVGGRLK